MGGHYKKVINTQPQATTPYQPTNPSAQILECADLIVIKQHLSKIEAVTGIDKRNRYQIWDGRTGNQMFNAEEGDIGCLTRGCFQGDREFDMPFVDAMGQQAFKLNKTRSYGLRGCCILGCKAHFDKSCLKFAAVMIMIFLIYQSIEMAKQTIIFIRFRISWDILDSELKIELLDKENLQ